jgi:hypothetical protein
VVYFLLVFLPISCMHSSSPPYVLYALPISLTWSKLLFKLQSKVRLGSIGQGYGRQGSSWNEFTAVSFRILSDIYSLIVSSFYVIQFELLKASLNKQQMNKFRRIIHEHSRFGCYILWLKYISSYPPYFTRLCQNSYRQVVQQTLQHPCFACSLTCTCRQLCVSLWS